jgi:hypothetical protein
VPVSEIKAARRRAVQGLLEATRLHEKDKGVRESRNTCPSSSPSCAVLCCAVCFQCIGCLLYLSVCLSVCQSLCLSVCVCVPFCSSVCVCPSVCLSICLLSVFLYVFIFLSSLYLFVCLSIVVLKDNARYPFQCGIEVQSPHHTQRNHIIPSLTPLYHHCSHRYTAHINQPLSASFSSLPTLHFIIHIL